MLDPEYLRHVADGAERVAEDIHEAGLRAIVERIMARLKRLGAAKKKRGARLLSASDKWMLETMQEAGALRDTLVQELAARTGLMQQTMKKAFDDAAVRDLEWDDAIYRAAGLEPPPYRMSPHLQRIVQRGYETTAGQWRNFTGTMADAGQQLFVRECDRAYNLVASGLMSYSQAISQAVDAAGKQGVVVRYPTGHQDTIETATRRAVLTGVGQACGDVTLARMEEMGWDIVLVSAHLGARTGDGGQDWTNHFWWQGKFYDRGNISVASLTQGRRGGAGLTPNGDGGKVQPSETYEPDIQIGRSLGAAAKRIRVKLPDGSYSYLTEGTKITKIVTFAGYGSKKPLRIANTLAKAKKTDAERWSHRRGDGYVDVDGRSKHAELHWFEHPEVGMVGVKAKRYFKK